MSTELATRDVDGWAPMLPAVGDLAGKIAATNFVPKALRGKPAEVAACILTGRELGIGPMESLQKVFVVDGKPTMSAELMRSLVLRAGHEITYAALTDNKVTVAGRRKGSDKWTEVTWTLEDAKRIGLAGKETWKKHPRQMLAARATSELCRLLFPDALGGVTLTPDEVEENEPSPATVTVSRSRKPALEPTPVPEPAALEVDTDTGEIIDAELVEPNTEPISQSQQAKMRVLLQAVGLTDRDAILQYVSSITGREVASSKDLTKDEASQVIDALDELATVEKALEEDQ